MVLPLWLERNVRLNASVCYPYSFFEENEHFLPRSCLPLRITPLLAAAVARLNEQDDEQNLASSLLAAVGNTTELSEGESKANAVAYIMLAFQSNWSPVVKRPSAYLDLARSGMRSLAHAGLQHFARTCRIESALILCEPIEHDDTREEVDPPDAYMAAFASLECIVEIFLRQMVRHRRYLRCVMNGDWTLPAPELDIGEKRAHLNSDFDLSAWERKHGAPNHDDHDASIAAEARYAGR